MNKMTLNRQQRGVLAEFDKHPKIGASHVRQMSLTLNIPTQRIMTILGVFREENITEFKVNSWSLKKEEEK